MDGRISRDDSFLLTALIQARRSTCLRRHVGCVLTNSRGHVLSTGYNGVAAGLPHCNFPQKDVIPPLLHVVKTSREGVDKGPNVYVNACVGAYSPSGTNLDGCEAIHAEQNALLQCKDVYDIEVCYCTASPCVTCTKLLLNTSCKKIYFLEEYPHSAAKDLWEKAGRVWLKKEMPIL